MRHSVKVEGLRFSYPDGTEALRGVDLSVKRGERLALLGPNGAGKSTLMLHLNGIHEPGEGSVEVAGMEVGGGGKRELRQKVGLLFQNPDDQLFCPTVRQDVAFGPTNLGLSRDEVDERVAEAAAIAGIEDVLDRPPHHLSGGQKKRAALAGVVAMHPEVLVLDEPTASLDPQGATEVMEVLGDWQREHHTIIVATHDVDLAAAWADRVAVMKGGRTLAQGGPELLRDGDVVEAAQLSRPTAARIFRDEDEPPLTVEAARRLLRDRYERTSR